MSMREVAIIEKIIRQQWYDGNDPEQERFGSWLGVDQDQALALLNLIPNRLPVRCYRLNTGQAVFNADDIVEFFGGGTQ